MTVAPELPPAPARRREAERVLAPPARAARRHPLGRAAHASTTRTVPPVDRPAPRAYRPAPPAGGPAPSVDRAAPPEQVRRVVRPGLCWEAESAATEVRPVGPTDTGWQVAEPGGDPIGAEWPTDEPGGRAGREHRPAGPVRLRPVGARVVRPARPALRLTRRGRVLVGLLVALVAAVTLAAAAVRVGSLEDTAPVPASAPAEVVVAPGETLWSIAERVAPEHDPRAVVSQIRRLNQLPTGDVQVGQTLRLRAS